MGTRKFDIIIAVAISMVALAYLLPRQIKYSKKLEDLEKSKSQLGELLSKYPDLKFKTSEEAKDFRHAYRSLAKKELPAKDLEGFLELPPGMPPLPPGMPPLPQTIAGDGSSASPSSEKKSEEPNVTDPDSSKSTNIEKNKGQTYQARIVAIEAKLGAIDQSFRDFKNAQIPIWFSSFLLPLLMYII